MKLKSRNRPYRFVRMAIFSLICCFSSIGSSFLNAGGETQNMNDHFDGVKYHNSAEYGDKVPENRGFLKAMKWFMEKEPSIWPDYIDEKPGAAPPEKVTGDHFRVTMIGHATLLFQIGEINILTDPMWSERCSPFSWIGPKRVRPPGIRFEDLPQIHLVLVSHNHYDHMDLPTLVRLEQRFHPKFVTPLGNRKFLQDEGLKDVGELDLWQSVEIDRDIVVTLVPTRHFSGRGIFDRDKTLWGGFVISTPKSDIFFAADTGYGGHFKEIGKRFNKIVLSAMPIGAYKPKWFMGPVHMSPDEALRAHREVGSNFSIGIHYETFRLAGDSFSDPREDLERERKKLDIPEIEFTLLNFGEGRDIKH
ncbi:MAG: MBL fold metallo-hydrolase [Oligoflexales bacterium]|nr:MBL fold metallo-hydrolase [Oligoflexales bacterium]